MAGAHYKQETYKKLFFICFFAFLLNLAWEIPHSLLYKTTNEMSQPEFVPRILKASAGDILMILMIFLGISIFNHSLDWKILKRKNILLSIILGIIISSAFELYSYNTGRFFYNSLMPLIPLTSIGISPVLQMIISPILTFWLAEKIAGDYNAKQ